MDKHPQRGIGFRFAFFTFLVWLAWSSITRLHAQTTYTSSPGKTSIYSYYDPNAPEPKAKAPGAARSTPSNKQPFLPAVPMDQYLTQKAEIAKYSQSSFSFPSQLESSS